MFGKRKINTDSEPSTSTKKSKKEHKQIFLESYTTEYPVLIKSRKSAYHAHCTVCFSDFKVSHGGLTDCREHVEGPSHKKKFQERKTQPTLAFARSNQEDINHRHKLTSAEILFTKYLVEHNIAISAADHAGPLFRKMFPDSKLAKEFQCARTKATSLIKHQGTKIANALVSKAQTVFTLSTDGSNDNGDKLYPIILGHTEKEDLCAESGRHCE